jgi:hypothetical protein
VDDRGRGRANVSILLSGNTSERVTNVVVASSRGQAHQRARSTKGKIGHLDPRASEC